MKQAPVNVIIIDPFDKTIKSVLWNGTTEHRRKLMRCEWIDIVHIQGEELLMVDEEGLLKPSGQEYFRLGSSQTMFDDERWVGPHLPLDFYERNVEWVTKPTSNWAPEVPGPIILIGDDVLAWLEQNAGKRS